MHVDRAGSFRAALHRLGVPRSFALTMALVSASYAAVLVAAMVGLSRPPQFSLSLAVSGTGAVRIGWVKPGGALWGRGVRAGDAVLTLDGRPPGRMAAGSWSGRRLLVRVARGRTILADAQAESGGALTWPLLALSPWFLLLGTLVALQAPDANIGRAAYALLGSAAFALALAPGADSDDLATTVLEWGAAALFAYSFLRFFLIFPVARGIRLLRVVLLAPPFAGVLAGVAANRWPTFYLAAELLRSGVLLGFLVAGIGFLAASVVGSQAGRTRGQLAVLAGGTAASVLPFALLTVLPDLLGHGPIVPPERAILALALLPLSFAYAILRYGVLDVHLLQRWLVQCALGIVLLGAGGAVVVALYRFSVATGGSPVSIAALALALLAGCAIPTLYARMQRILDGLIFKDAYDYRDSLQRLSVDLSLAGDLATLGAVLPDTLRGLMNLDFAALLVRRPDGQLHTLGAAGSHTSQLAQALLAASEARELPLAVALAGRPRPALLVPLRSHGGVTGYLCLGPKASGETFRAIDQDLLATLSGHAGAIIHSAQLIEDLQRHVRLLDTLNERLQRAHEEERARLSMDLHDEPLQTAYALMRRLATAAARGGRDARQDIALAQSLIDQLRALCTVARPSALDELGLAPAIEALALEHAARAEVRIRLDLAADLSGADLPPGGELLLYRAVREAFANSLRHGQARVITISLNRCGRTAHLRVADDGLGFAVPEQLEDLAETGHLGLIGLHYSVQRAGGRLSVTSAPGAGTVMQVEVPLAGEAL